jgi:hypothetical protein
VREVSGRCCRFDEYGHTLFLSRPEAELLLEQGLPEGARVEPGRCPFQVGTLCTARERRPFGCRVYFCDPRYAGVGEQLTEKHLAELKAEHARQGVAWEYRPLHHWLRDFSDPADSAEDSGEGGR